MTTPDPISSSAQHQPIPAAAGPLNTRPLLWLTALVLAVLVMIQAQPLLAQLGGSNRTAQAGMVTQSGNFVLLTAEANNEDLVVVLDGRSEEIFVYRTERNGMQLYQRIPLTKLFQDVRASSMGRP